MNGVNCVSPVIVGRQLSRGFGLNKDEEILKIISRFPIYKKLGNIQIFSRQKPMDIAKKINNKIESLISGAGLHA